MAWWSQNTLHILSENIGCSMTRGELHCTQKKKILQYSRMMSIWKQNKVLGTYGVSSAYICRTKQWSFFFWYYIHGIEKTIYYGSKSRELRVWGYSTRKDSLTRLGKTTGALVNTAVEFLAPFKHIWQSYLFRIMRRLHGQRTH